MTDVPVSGVDITSLAFANDAGTTFTQVSPSNGFPVTFGGSGNSATVSINQVDADANSVNIKSVGGTAVEATATGAGTVSAQTPRTTQASDSPVATAVARAAGATPAGGVHSYGALANASAPSLTEARQYASSMDLHGSTRVLNLDGNGAAIDPTTPVSVFQSNSYTPISTQTTTLVKSGSGTFAKLVINTPLANGTVTIYDALSATGTPIGTVTQPAALLSSGPSSIEYDIAFTTGLTIVTGGANQNLTIAWR